MPRVAATISSPALKHGKRTLQELRRIVTGAPHRIEIYLKLSDPYSYLLLQVLDRLQARFDAQLSLYLVQELEQEMFPEFSSWQQYSLRDARYLAELYGLELPELEEFKPEPSGLIKQLLESSESDLALERWKDCFSEYWKEASTNSGQEPPLDPLNLKALRANEQRLKQRGHYLSATLHYGGEWYWGLDRLDHLERRLNDLGLNREARPLVEFDLTWRSFCAKEFCGLRATEEKTEASQALTMFFSARSPYSYLGLERAIELSRHYQIPLHIKPVLPMVMRGLPVPPTKKMYIFLDTKREAEKLGIPYGKVADPVGPGVERCYALFSYAQQQHKEIEFLQSFARQVNAQGIRAETDQGMQKIVELAGLNWTEAKRLLDGAHAPDASWRSWETTNREQLKQLGLWGVPCFLYGETAVWGQDRLFVIENALRASTPENKAIPA